MRKEVVLITGANGEIGHGLITLLAEQNDVNVIALDVQPLDDELKPYCMRFIQGDILDGMLLGRLVVEYEIRTIYHLASILSTKAEYNPEAAHRINVEGTLNLLRLAVEQSQWQGRPVKFIYPSSIAAYGLPGLEVKNCRRQGKRSGLVQPDHHVWLQQAVLRAPGPLLLTALPPAGSRPGGNTTVDFRCAALPGLISAVTIPTGGTSDYGPEMLHHAAQGLPYECFVRPDTRLPFMAMPDAIKSLLLLEAAPVSALTQLVYNVTSFSPSAQEIYEIVKEAFPAAEVTLSRISAARRSWTAGQPILMTAPRNAIGAGNQIMTRPAHLKST